MRNGVYEKTQRSQCEEEFIHTQLNAKNKIAREVKQRPDRKVIRYAFGYTLTILFDNRKLLLRCRCTKYSDPDASHENAIHVFATTPKHSRSARKPGIGESEIAVGVEEGTGTNLSCIWSYKPCS